MGLSPPHRPEDWAAMYPVRALGTAHGAA